jgi:hypothetical protein
MTRSTLKKTLKLRRVDDNGDIEEVAKETIYEEVDVIEYDDGSEEMSTRN